MMLVSVKNLGRASAIGPGPRSVGRSEAAIFGSVGGPAPLPPVDTVNRLGDLPAEESVASDLFGG